MLYLLNTEHNEILEQYYKTGVIKTVNSSKLNAVNQSTYRLQILCKAKTPATVSLHFENNEMTVVIKKIDAPELQGHTTDGDNSLLQLTFGQKTQWVCKHASKVKRAIF